MAFRVQGKYCKRIPPGERWLKGIAWVFCSCRPLGSLFLTRPRCLQPYSLRSSSIWGLVEKPLIVNATVPMMRRHRERGERSVQYSKIYVVVKSWYWAWRQCVQLCLDSDTATLLHWYSRALSISRDVIRKSIRLAHQYTFISLVYFALVESNTHIF